MKNTMKEKLLAGKSVLGVSVMIPSPQIVEMFGHLGFDWLLIDCEHGTISLETVELMIMAAEVSGITPIVRPRDNSTQEIMRVMDRGAKGVQVPHVITAQDAKRVVEAVKFYPLGKRGLAKGTRPAGYGFDLSMQEYVKKDNQETLVCIQLEDKEAIDNVEEILQVEEIDVFFIGPSDLSQSMGYPGQKDAPEVQKAIWDTLKAIKSAGKISGSTGSYKDIQTYLEQGVQYIYTHLPTLLKNGSQEFLNKFKS